MKHLFTFTLAYLFATETTFAALGRTIQQQPGSGGTKAATEKASEGGSWFGERQD